MGNQIDSHIYESIRSLLYEKTGITIGPNKQDFLINRLGNRVRKLNCSYSGYLKIIKDNPKEVDFFVNSLTTNKTDFFREDRHFDRLKDICEQKYRHDTVYIWSAACSNGSEVYTIGMLLSELEINYRILGSDIDTNMLTYANKALYSESDLGNLPENYYKYFVKKNGGYKVCEKIRKNIKFKKANLMNNLNLPLSFHFVFLRNILIYFEQKSHEKAIDNVYNNLKKDGVLFIGHSESLEHRKDNFTSLDGSSFIKN